MTDMYMYEYSGLTKQFMYIIKIYKYDKINYLSQKEMMKLLFVGDGYAFEQLTHTREEIKLGFHSKVI